MCRMENNSMNRKDAWLESKEKWHNGFDATNAIMCADEYIKELEEKVKVYETLLHNIHFARTVEMNEKRVKSFLNRISTWSISHRIGDGTLADEYQQELIKKAFFLLKEPL